MQEERDSKIKVHQLSNTFIANAHKLAQESLSSNRLKVAAQSKHTIIKTAAEVNLDKSAVTQIRLDQDEHPRHQVHFNNQDELLVDQLTHTANGIIEASLTQLDKSIVDLFQKIKHLKYSGRHVCLKLNVENLEDSCVFRKKEDNSLVFERVDGTKMDLAASNSGNFKIRSFICKLIFLLLVHEIDWTKYILSILKKSE